LRKGTLKRVSRKRTGRGKAEKLNLQTHRAWKYKGTLRRNSLPNRARTGRRREGGASTKKGGQNRRKNRETNCLKVQAHLTNIKGEKGEREKKTARGEVGGRTAKEKMNTENQLYWQIWRRIKSKYRLMKCRSATYRETYKRFLRLRKQKKKRTAVRVLEKVERQGTEQE